MAATSPPGSLLHRLFVEKTWLREDQVVEKQLLGSDKCSLLRHLKMAKFGSSEVFLLISETSMNFLLHLFFPAANKHKVWVLNRDIHQYNVNYFSLHKVWSTWAYQFFVSGRLLLQRKRSEGSTNSWGGWCNELLPFLHKLYSTDNFETNFNLYFYDLLLAHVHRAWPWNSRLPVHWLESGNRDKKPNQAAE